MASYRYLSVDLVTGTIRDELPLTSCTFGAVRNGAAPFAASMPATHRLANLGSLDAGRTLVVVERDGQVVGDGIVWSPLQQRERRAAEATLDLEGASLASWLDLQRVRQTRTYTGVPQDRIAADLVAYAQGRGSTTFGPAGPAAAELNIATSHIAGVQQPRDRTYHGYERGNVYELLGNLGDVIGGPTWRVVVAWSPDGQQLVRRLEVDPPGGRLLGSPLLYGSNVDGYRYGRLGSRLATVVDAVGAGEGDDQLVRTASDPTAQPTYPYAVAVVSHLSVTEPATLVGHAQAALAERRRPPSVLEVTLVPGTDPPLGSFRPGDRALVRIADGWAQADEVRRIVGYEVQVDREGRERVTVAFDRPDAAGEG